MNALPEVGDQFPFESLGVADAGLGAGGVVEEVGLEGPAEPGLSVPATARVPGTRPTAGVTDRAEVQVDLSDAAVRGDVQLAPVARDLHGSDRLLLQGGLEGVEELGLQPALVISPLGHFVHLASLGPNIEHGELPEEKKTCQTENISPFNSLLVPVQPGVHLVHHDVGEDDVALVEGGGPALVSHGAVHQRVGPDEVENSVRELPGVLNTGPRPGLRHLAARHRQPRARARLLLLELAVEGRADVVNVEGADAGAQEAIEVGGWWSMAAVLNGAYRSVLQTRMKLNRIILCLISVRPVLIEKKNS